MDIDLIRQYREEILMDDKHLKECQEKLTEICRKEFPREFDNLQTIPGVKERSATSILSELGADMKMFIYSGCIGVVVRAQTTEMKKATGKIKYTKNHTW